MSKSTHKIAVAAARLAANRQPKSQAMLDRDAITATLVPDLMNRVRANAGIVRDDAARAAAERGAAFAASPQGRRLLAARG